MKAHLIISGILFGTMFLSSLSAQNENCYVKKSFPAPKGTKISLSNKYGDINVINDNRDSLSVCATITVDQDDRDIARNSIRLIAINISNLSDSISVSTLYDKEFFSSKYRKRRKSFSVDYTVKAPSYVNIYIINAFGNVLLDELAGYVNISVSHGFLSSKKLSRGNVKPINSIFADQSDVSLNALDWLYLTSRNCPSVRIGKVQALMMTSTFSKINIDEVNSIVIDSKSDTYHIGSLKNMSSQSAYSKFDIFSLNGQMISNTVFGSLDISNLKKEFSTVNIKSVNTPISITTEKGISFRTDITAFNNPVVFPYQDDPGITLSGNNLSTTIKGVAGSDKKTSSLIKIDAMLGNLTIK